MTISLRAARSLIVGDVSLFGDALTTQGDTNTYEITDFSSFSVYRVESTIGTATISGSTITLVMPGSTSATQVTLTVFKDDRPNYFVIAVGAESIAQPVVTSPAANATQVSLTPTIQVNGFATIPAGQDTHVSTNWQVAADINFTNLKVNSMGDTVNKTTYSVPSGALSINADYYIRVQFTGTTLGTSAWSVPTKITTRSQYIATPTITVEGGPITVSESPKLTASAFIVLGGGSDAHATTDWQVINTTTQAVVWQSLGNSANKLSVNVPSNLLLESTQYTARVRFSGASLGASGWGEATFTTVAQFEYGKYLAKWVYENASSKVYGIDVTNPIELTQMIGTDSQAFSPDGKHLAMASGYSYPTNSYISIRKRTGDVFTGLVTLEPMFSQRFISCVYSRDGSAFYATALDGNGGRTAKYAVQGDTYVKQADLTLPGNPFPAHWHYRDMTFSADGNTFAAIVGNGGNPADQAYGYFMVWDHNNGAFTNPRIFTPPVGAGGAIGWYSRVVAHPTQNIFAFRNQGNTLYVVRVTPTAVTQQLMLTNTDCGEIAFDASGQYMLFGVTVPPAGGSYLGYYNAYKLTGTDVWSFHSTIRSNQHYPVLCKFTPDNTLFLSNGFNWTINSFDPVTGAVTQLNEIAGTGFSGYANSADSRVWPSVA